MKSEWKLNKIEIMKSKTCTIKHLVVICLNLYHFTGFTSDQGHYVDRQKKKKNWKRITYTIQGSHMKTTSTKNVFYSSQLSPRAV